MRKRIDTRMIVALVVAVFVIGLYSAVVSLSERFYVGATPPGSTFSKTAGGLSMLFAYLERLGAEPVELRRFDELPDPARSTIVVATGLPVFAKAPSPGDQASLAEWVRKGGRLVLLGESALALAADMRIGGAAAEGPDRELEPLLPSQEAAGRLRPGPGRVVTSDSGWATHYKDTSGQAIVSRAVGEGEVWWVASVDPFSNAGLGDADNGAIAVRMLTADGRRPYFDEYHHGYARGGGVWERLRPRGRAAVALLALALGVLVLARGRRLGAPIAPVETHEARSDAHIGQLAELYRKSGARAEALAVLEDGLGRSLARRYGTKAAGIDQRPAAAEALAASAALRERDGIGKDEFIAAAERLRHAREEIEGAWRTSRK